MSEPRTAPAMPTRSEAEARVLDALDARLVRLAKEFGGHELTFATLVSREVLERAEYPAAFPHLLLGAVTAHEPDVPPDRLFEPANHDAPAWFLSPAVCYHVYAEFAGRVLREPVVVTSRGRCFRNEATTRPGLRQLEFEMREIVLLGPADRVEERASQLRSGVERIARQAGLDGDWEVAEDPFFLPRQQGKALLQRVRETKHEYAVAHDGSRVAVASVNRHGTFFGERFGIRDRHGEPVHTACVAAGLDRWLTLGSHDDVSTLREGIDVRPVSR